MPQQVNKLSARTPAAVRQSLYVMPLLLLLLFLCCASVCVAQKDGGVQSTGVVRELPRKGQSGVQAYTVATDENEGWKLIRIKAFTKDLENKSRYCTKVGDEVMDFQDDTDDCVGSQILTDEKKSMLIDHIIPGAIKLHRDRLRVQPQEGKLKVPKFENGNPCTHFTVPSDHHSEGVENADFVLYVAAGPGEPFGVTCASEESSSRPIAGAMNFPPYYLVDPRLNVRIAAHEMAHALGFNIPSMKQKGVLTQANIRGKNRMVVSSKVTKEKAQEHYGCPSLPGMELDNDDETDDNGIHPHWTQRVAHDELMAPREEEGVGIYYTALTMAFFEDLGYYKANWGMEEPMSWGHKKGCSFINEACIKNRISQYPETFCNTSTTRCTSNRYALGECESLEDLDADNEIDFCPIIVGSTVIQEGGDSQPTSFCTFGDESLLTGSLMGPDSWCLDGEGLQVQNTRKSVESLSGVCARVKCSSGGGVKVQYKGSDKWHDCPEGTSIDVESSAFQSGGKIKCPKYDEVCTITPDGRSRLSMNVEPDSTRRAAALSALVPLAMTFTLMGLL